MAYYSPVFGVIPLSSVSSSNQAQAEYLLLCPSTYNNRPCTIDGRPLSNANNFGQHQSSLQSSHSAFQQSPQPSNVLRADIPTPYGYVSVPVQMRQDPPPQPRVEVEVRLTYTPAPPHSFAYPYPY